MRHLPTIILTTILSALLLAACSDDKELLQRIALADSLLYHRPDSAYAILDSITIKAQSLSRSNRMRYELVKADAQNKSYIAFTSDSIMRQVADYYDSHGSSNEQMRAYYLLGRVYNDLGEIPLSMECFNTASEKNDTINRNCDYRILSRVHGQIAQLIYDQYLWENAIHEYHRAQKYAEKAGDSISVYIYYEAIGDCYGNLGKRDSALSAYERASESFLRAGMTEDANLSLGPAASICTETGDLVKAKKYLDLYEHHSTLTPEAIAKHEQWKLLYIYKGDYYDRAGIPDSALYNYRKAMSLAKKSNTYALAYSGLYNVYKKLGNKDSIAKYAMLCNKENDQTLKDNIAANVQQLLALYNYSRHKRIADEKIIEAQQANTLLAIFIFCAILLLMAASIFVVHINERSRLRLRQINNKYVADILLYKKEKAELKALIAINEDAKEQIRVKENIISELEANIASYHADNSKPRDWSAGTDILDSEIVEKFHKAALTGKPVSDTEWNELRENVNKCLPAFIKNLSNFEYQMNLRETNVCLLIKLRFLPSEMCFLVNMKPSALSNLRQRLYTKLYGTHGSTRDLEVKLMEM